MSRRQVVKIRYSPLKYPLYSHLGFLPTLTGSRYLCHVKYLGNPLGYIDDINGGLYTVFYVSPPP